MSKGTPSVATVPKEKRKNQFLSEIGKKQVKLKKTEILNDKSGPQLKGYLTNEEIKQYDEYVNSFDIENWYEILKEITFPTEYVELNYNDAVILHTICLQIEKLKKQITISSDNEKLQKKLIEQCANLDLSKLNKLMKKIDIVIDQWKVTDDDSKNDEEDDFGVFVKLSSRSAKDATNARERLKVLFEKYCKQNKVVDDNDRVRELLKAATHCMKVANANQVIQMFINSGRITHDVGSYLKYGNENNTFKQNVVIRKWIPIDIDMEFRGFVCNGKLNALSQYNYFIFFERLVKMKIDISKMIQTFWNEKCKNQLSKSYQDGYVIDFAICGGKLDQILIIELNPFMESTDAALFSWKKGKKILMNGPFEFRINETKPTGRVNIEHKYKVILGWE